PVGITLSEQFLRHMLGMGEIGHIIELRIGDALEVAIPIGMADFIRRPNNATLGKEPDITVVERENVGLFLRKPEREQPCQDAAIAKLGNEAGAGTATNATMGENLEIAAISQRRAPHVHIDT